MNPNKLNHISDLPNYLHYLPMEVKHFLPIHFNNFRDNVMTMIYHQSSHTNSRVFPDNNLKLQSPTYQHLTGGWAEDIDDQDNHLKSSLELGTIILNYLHTQFEELNKNFKNKIQEPRSEPSGQFLIRKEHKYQDQEDNLKSNGEKSMLMYCQPWMAYNIYKTQDGKAGRRNILVVGWNSRPQARYCCLFNSVRLWNICRFNISTMNSISITRFHLILEHLIIICREFLELESESVNNHKKILQNILTRITSQPQSNPIPRIDLPKDQILILSKYQINYRQKTPTEQDLWSALIEIVQDCLILLPINTQWSFATKNVINQDLNQITITCLSNYRKPIRGSLKYLAKNHVEKTSDRAIQFMRKKIFDGTRETANTIADELFKSSISVFHKYQDENQQNKSRNKFQEGPKSQYDYLGLTSNKKKAVRSGKIEESIIEFEPQNLGWEKQQLHSMSSSQLKESQLNKSVIKPHHQSFHISNQKQFQPSHLSNLRDHQYSHLLQSIQTIETEHELMNFQAIKKYLGNNCEASRHLYSKSSELSGKQWEFGLATAATIERLEPSQYYLLFEKNQEQIEALMQILVQRCNPDKIKRVCSLIIQDHIPKLYQEYILTNFQTNKRHFLVKLLKKLQIIYLKPSIAVNIQNIIQNNSIIIPILVELLEKKNYQSDKYKNLMAKILNQIFIENVQLQTLSPILFECFTILTEDHHEELVNGFLGDFAFEIVYFAKEQSVVELNNNAYFKEENLKVKKLLQMIRQGGFNRLGYELRNILKPIFFKNQHFQLPVTCIYSEISIQRSFSIKKFLNILSKSHHTPNLMEITEYFNRKQDLFYEINGSFANVYLKKEAISFVFESNQNEEQLNFNNSKSQSGIFNYLLAYNPQIKLAGMPLSKALSSKIHHHSSTSSNLHQKYQLTYLLSEILTINLQEAYQYIKIIKNLKDKYAGYETLASEEKLYFKEITDQISCKKYQINQYLHLNQTLTKYLEFVEIITYLF